MAITTNIFERNTITTADTSGLSTIIDVANYTAFFAQGTRLLISRVVPDSRDRIAKAFDNLSDEIGITHEEASGEVVTEGEE